MINDGIERVVHGLWEENLGVFASLCETKPDFEKERTLTPGREAAKNDQ